MVSRNIPDGAPVFFAAPTTPSQSSVGPVGGRLLSFTKEWQLITDDSLVLSIVREGYRLEFERHPPLTMSPFVTVLPGNKQKREALLEAIQKRGSQTGERYQCRSRVLQPPVFGAKKIGGVAPNSEPNSTESIHDRVQVQDGDHAIHSRRCSARGMDGVNRSKGRIFSCTDSRFWRPSLHPLSFKVPIRPSLRLHLLWWVDENNLLEGRSLAYQKANLSLFTDASKEGWGAHCDSQVASGQWGGVTSQRHINWLELKAVFLALVQFETLVSARHVLLHSDNTTVVAYVNKWGAQSHQTSVICSGT